MANFAWKDHPEAVEMLKRLVTDRRSANQAARELSAAFDVQITRSAVMGKATMIGLHFMSTDATTRRPKSTVAMAKAVRKPAPALARVTPFLEPIMETVEAIDVAIPTSRRVELVELTNATCRWPLWRGDEPRLFCGAHGADFSAGLPYCAEHSKQSIPRVFTKEERAAYKQEKALVEIAKKRGARAV
ncbi:MAG TPA: GcrA family cell cycle regulator [Methylocystis sp.]|jgi:hypothetical protein